MNNVENIILSIMTISDLENIKDILISDFDDYWNYNTLKEELTCKNSIYAFFFCHIYSKSDKTNAAVPRKMPCIRSAWMAVFGNIRYHCIFFPESYQKKGFFPAAFSVPKSSSAFINPPSQ